MRILLFIFLSIFVSNCKNSISEPVDSSIESYAALEELIADPAKRNEFKKISWEFWNSIQPYGCRGCHGGSGGVGWENAKLPSFSYFASASLKFMGVNESEPGLRSLDMTRIAAIMPPPRAGGMVADYSSLNSISDPSDPRAAKALGDRILYVNDAGLCIDPQNTGIDPFGDSICKPLEAIRKFTKNWSQVEWNRIVNRARGENMNHYDPAEGVWKNPILDAFDEDENDNTASGGGRVGNVQVVFKRPNYTIAYFVKPAPDDSFVAYTLQKRNVHRYLPRAYSLHDSGKEYFFKGIGYDPIFSPDYNHAKKTGFIMGGKGAGGGSANKYYGFYKPIGQGNVSSGNRVSPSLNQKLMGIWGYGTIAKITNPEVVSSQWQHLENQYVIIGKTGNWIAMKPKLNRRGQISEFRVFGGTRGNKRNGAVIKPVCPGLSTGSDAMISPNGEWISGKNPSSKSTYILNTKTCQKIRPKIGTRTLRAGKISFSNDGRYATFHAWGVDGTQFKLVPYMKDDEILKLANNDIVANIFTIDLRSQEKIVRQHTFYRPTDERGSPNEGPYVSVFPTFNGDSTKLYFDRHKKGARESEIVYLSKSSGTW